MCKEIRRDFLTDVDLFYIFLSLKIYVHSGYFSIAFKTLYPTKASEPLSARWLRVLCKEFWTNLKPLKPQSSPGIFHTRWEVGLTIPKAQRASQRHRGDLPTCATNHTTWDCEQIYWIYGIFTKRENGPCGSVMRRAVKAAAVRGCPVELHKSFYIRVVSTAVNAAICTATDGN